MEGGSGSKPTGSGWFSQAGAPRSGRFRIGSTRRSGGARRAARSLAWLRRCAAGDAIDVSCLSLGHARILHLPGELFVEVPLAAQKLRPDLFVSMAGYGDYAPGYVGAKVAYGQRGYETSTRASRVAPGVERVLMDEIGKLLK